MAVATGQYDRKVTFRKPTTIVNGEGGQETSYADELVNVPAKIKRTNQFRALEANATALINSDVVTIRNASNRDQINQDWLVSYDSEDHIIHSIDRSKTEVVLIVKGKGKGNG